MTQPSQGATNSVEAVAFSFLTDDEIRRSSRVKITNPILVDYLLHPYLVDYTTPLWGPSMTSLCMFLYAYIHYLFWKLMFWEEIFEKSQSMWMIFFF